MTLTVYRNSKYCISDMSFECDKEEIYENVEDIFMEIEGSKKFNDDGTTEKYLLLLFKDQEHQSLLGQNYVYLRKGDTISIK